MYSFFSRKAGTIWKGDVFQVFGSQEDTGAGWNGGPTSHTDYDTPVWEHADRDITVYDLPYPGGGAGSPAYNSYYYVIWYDHSDHWMYKGYILKSGNQYNQGLWTPMTPLRKLSLGDYNGYSSVYLAKNIGLAHIFAGNGWWLDYIEGGTEIYTTGEANANGAESIEVTHVRTPDGVIKLSDFYAYTGGGNRYYIYTNILRYGVSGQWNIQYYGDYMGNEIGAPEFVTLDSIPSKLPESKIMNAKKYMKPDGTFYSIYGEPLITIKDTTGDGSGTANEPPMNATNTRNPNDTDSTLVHMTAGRSDGAPDITAADTTQNGVSPLGAGKNSGWRTINGKFYVFNSDNQTVKTGWFTDTDGHVYYLSPIIMPAYYKDNAFYMGEPLKHTFVNISGQWFWIDANYNKAVNTTLTINGRSYTFDTNGYCTNFPAAGWLTIGTKKYYINADGTLNTDRFLDTTTGKYYFFAEYDGELSNDGTYTYSIGEMKFNDWVVSLAHTYRVQSDGTKFVGDNLTVGGKIYKFDANGGCLNFGNGRTVGWWTDTDGAVYNVDSSGNFKTGAFTDTDSSQYYLTEVPGFDYNKSVTFKLGQKQTNNWHYTGSVWNRYDANGKMIKNTTVTIDGTSRTFDVNGVCTTTTGLVVPTSNTGKLIVHSLNTQQSGGYDDGANAVLLEYNGLFALIDAGGQIKSASRQSGVNGSSSSMDSADNLTAKLNAYGVKQLEFMVISNFHYQNSMFATQMLNNFKPKKVYGITPGDLQLASSELNVDSMNYVNTKEYVAKTVDTITNNALNSIGANGLGSFDSVKHSHSGFDKLGDVNIQFFIQDLPPNATPNADYTTGSIVTLAQLGTKKFLFASDVTPDVSESLADQIGVIDVLFAPGRGVPTKNTIKLVKTLQPKHVVVNSTSSSNLNAENVLLHKTLNGATLYKFNSDMATENKFTTDGTTITASGTTYAIPANRWLHDGTTNDWYFYNGSAVKVVNAWVTHPVTGKLYRVDANGKLVRGWFTDTDGSIYYLSPYVTMDYYDTVTFNDGEKQVNNWVFDGTHWLYVKSDGKRATNETVTVNGTARTFDVNGYCTNV